MMPISGEHLERLDDNLVLEEIRSIPSKPGNDYMSKSQKVKRLASYCLDELII